MNVARTRSNADGDDNGSNGDVNQFIYSAMQNGCVTINDWFSIIRKIFFFQPHTTISISVIVYLHADVRLYAEFQLNFDLNAFEMFD